MSRRAQGARRRARAGMTLIEVLLAVVILGMALGALIEAASRALAVVRQAANYEMARRMLGRVDAEEDIIWLRDTIEEGVKSGGFKDGPRGWSWERTLEDGVDGVEDEKHTGKLFQLTTRVFWSNGDRRGMEETVRKLFVPYKNGKYTLRPTDL